jgi:hypothetical protein
VGWRGGWVEPSAPYSVAESIDIQCRPAFTDVDKLLAKKLLAVKLPVSHDAIVRAMENKQAFVRAAIREKLDRDGLLDHRV